MTSQRDTVVILGCVYTGRRVAQRLLRRGFRVIVTSRTPELLTVAGAEEVAFEAAPDASLAFVPSCARVVYSIPSLEPDPAPVLLRRLADGGSRRLVYLSTTSVYGEVREVDEYTPPAPRTPPALARSEAERTVLEAAGSRAIVLRPAAIYGPDRGIHTKIRAGTFRLAGTGDNYVSRIHVEDLAALVEAALFAEVSGAWPVADDEPCRSKEIARFCAELFGVPVPAGVPAESLHHTRRADRRVDGRAIRDLLGVQLRFPSYRQGILHSADD